MGNPDRCNGEVLLQGIVQPWGWDAGNNVTNVMLCCEGERDYFVKPDSKGSELIALCGKFVTVRGVLSARKGPSQLQVLCFEEKGLF